MSRPLTESQHRYEAPGSWSRLRHNRHCRRPRPRLRLLPRCSVSSTSVADAFPPYRLGLPRCEVRGSCPASARPLNAGISSERNPTQFVETYAASRDNSRKRKPQEFGRNVVKVGCSVVMSAPEAPKRCDSYLIDLTSHPLFKRLRNRKACSNGQGGNNRRTGNRSVGKAERARRDLTQEALAHASEKK
jgi:hypothetical protein